MNRMCVSVGAWAAVCALSVLSSSAETLAWYHFSEGADGTKASTAEGAIKDSSPRQKHGTVTPLHNKTAVTDDALAPTYRSDYGCTVIDPLNGTSWSSGTALDFAAIGNSTAQTGATVRVASFMGSGVSFGSITVEALVCTTGGAYNTFAPIVGYCAADAECLGENWSLLMNPNGKIAVRFSGNISSGTSYSSGRHVINDGRWHSVALVHDAEKDFNAQGQPLVRVYVDGEEDLTTPYAFGSKRMEYSNGPLLIGGYYGNINGRLFNGLIDEVRVSDVALEPEQLLRVSRRQDPIDDDTLIYVPFDRMPGRQSVNTPNLNLVANGPTACLKRSGQGVTTGIPNAEFTKDLFADFFALGRFSQDLLPNGTSLRLGVSESGNGWGVECARSSYMATNFTAEIFFKSDGQITATDTYFWNLLRCGKAGSESMYLKLGNRFRFVHNSWNEGAQAYTASWHDIGVDHEFDDGKWHHFAVVYDRDNRRMFLYADGRVRYFGENVNLEPTDYLFFVSNNPSGDTSGYVKGWIDEFRFTKRALTPNEFLCVPNDGKDTLLRASFENDWKATGSWGELADATPVDAVSFVNGEDERLAGDLVWETNEVAGMSCCTTNLHAVRDSRGYVGFPEIAPYEGKDLTVELFVKLSAWDAQANIFRLVFGDNPSYDGSPIVALYPAAATSSSLSVLSTRTTYSTNDLYLVKSPQTTEQGVEWNSLSLPPGKNLADGRWHHLALVVSTSVDDAGVESAQSTLYVDHEAGGSKTHVGHLPFRSPYTPRPRLSLGCGVSGNRMNAQFDEVRITARALKPSEFLSMTRLPRGMMLIVR